MWINATALWLGAPGCRDLADTSPAAPIQVGNNSQRSGRHPPGLWKVLSDGSETRRFNIDERLETQTLRLCDKYQEMRCFSEKVGHRRKRHFSSLRLSYHPCYMMDFTGWLSVMRKCVDVDTTGL